MSSHSHTYTRIQIYVAVLLAFLGHSMNVVCSTEFRIRCVCCSKPFFSFLPFDKNTQRRKEEEEKEEEKKMRINKRNYKWVMIKTEMATLHEHRHTGMSMRCFISLMEIPEISSSLCMLFPSAEWAFFLLVYISELDISFIMKNIKLKWKGWKFERAHRAHIHKNMVGEHKSGGMERTTEAFNWSDDFLEAKHSKSGFSAF